jgi:hypothetical protein
MDVIKYKSTVHGHQLKARQIQSIAFALFVVSFLWDAANGLFSRKRAWSALLINTFLAIMCSFYSLAQEVRILERKVTITAQNERLDGFLKRISLEAGCVFSYSSSAIDVSRTVSGSFKNSSLREILEVIFESRVQIKEKGIYVILTPKPSITKDVVITGYVVDEAGKGIRDATVYDPITLKSSTTDQYGFFQFELKNPAAGNFDLIVTKKDFSDTLVIDDFSPFRKILLKAEEVKLDEVGKSISNSAKTFWVWTKNSVGIKNNENVKDTIHRDFQVSLLPFVGTNRKLSGSVINDYSFNVLGGFSGGTNKAELGGLFNINRGDVKSFQSAGLFNQVGGKVKGVQLAGLVNSALDSVNAAQFAGLANFTTDPASGLQMAGLMNLSVGNFKGTQLAGLVNYAHREVKGAQISGILNIGQKVIGTQLGLFNYADSISGVPIGLISFVRRGYHNVEIGADEILPFNLSLRSGTRSFYTMIFAGFRPEQADSVTWAFGYGIGTSPQLGKKKQINFELSSEQLNKGNVLALNLINSAYLGFDYQLSKGFGLYAGPTLNLRVYDSSYSDHPDLFTFSYPKFLSEKTYSVENLASQLWIGLRAGIRVF